MKNETESRKPIRFCDLQKEYSCRTDEILDVLRDPITKADFCNGEQVRLFEQEFAQYHAVPFCCGVGSGTDALFLAMKALGIGEGDEVIVPANTFISTALAVYYNHATPVFCDCEPDTWEISVSSAERSITPCTKAIVPVHLYGQACDMDHVEQLAKAHNLIVIEDCAQANGSEYKGRKVGTMSDSACFSFYPTKNLGAIGDAGAVLTPHLHVKEHVDRLRNLSLDKATGDHPEIGYNMRMDSLQAAVLRHKLPQMESDTARRTQIAQTYLHAIDNPRIRMQTVGAGCIPVWNLFCVCVSDREQFLRHMEDRQIYCGVHYAIPCHLQGAFRYLGYSRGDLPHCETLNDHCVTLPLYPDMDESDLQRVIEASNTFKG